MLLKAQGLRDHIAGSTALSTVGQHGHGLSYRGYDIHSLANQASFEETVFLLWFGELPTAAELLDFKLNIAKARELSPLMCQVLESIPSHAHPMDVLRTGVSILGITHPEKFFQNQIESSIKLLALMPAMIGYWYCFHRDGKAPEMPNRELSTAEFFLTLLTGHTPSKLHIKTMDISLILYAEHEFNASTFASRVCASTLSDMYSSVVAAIGTLKGTLHGGANEAAMDLILSIRDTNDVEDTLLSLLSQKQKVMGFGHAVYTQSDPRSDIIKAMAKQLSEASDDALFFEISCACEAFMWRTKKLCCNADFFHASAYYYMGIPKKLFTPIFVCSRTSGWTAHVMEQRKDNRIIRPRAEYIGHVNRTFKTIEKRNHCQEEAQ